jgi:hypothetical protein
MPEPSFTSSLSVWEPKTHLCQTVDRFGAFGGNGRQ